MSLWDAFGAAAAARAAHAAFLTADGPVTFAAVRTRAEDFRRFLREQGVAQGDRVLLSVFNGADMAAAMLGTWGCGAIVCLLDSAAPESHFAHAVATVAPRVLLFAPNAPPKAAGVPAFATSDVASGDADPASAPRVLPTDPASVVFTSGSTGRPKGVVQTHGNILRGCRAVAGYLGLAAEDRLLCPVPWAFDYGYVQLHFTLFLGVTQVVVTQANPFNVCAAISEHRPTALAGLPSLYTFLLRGVSPLKQTDLSSLRTLTNTGGTIPGPVLRDLLDAFATAKLVLNYGLTETYRTSFLDPALVRTHAHTIGKPIPGAGVVIAREDGTLAAPDEVGEIVHRGDYICLGYWNDPAATARAIRPDPLAPAGSPDRGRALYTGDYGFLDAEGFLHFRGRRDHQLKSMGVRVSPGEVEALLHESGLVREVAVFGVPHELIGDEVWAAVTPAGDAAGLQQKLVAYARSAMSQYMQPRRWLIKPALPKTTTGKMDYPALKQEAAAAPSAKLS